MTTSKDARRPPSLAAPGTLLLTHFAITLLYLIDFLIFQAAAAGATLAIYTAIPALHTGVNPDDPSWNWIRIFQIVSPAITLPGGVATVLSSYIFARRVQEETRRAEEEARLREAAEKERQEETRLREAAEKERQEEARRAQEETRRREAAEKAQQETEAENRLLKAQLAQATAPRRRRRHLRNNHSQPSE